MTEQTRKGIIAFSVTDLGALYSAYMPQVNNGGIFVPTPRAYQLGDEVFLLLRLMDETQPTPVTGDVVWVTPPGSQGNKAPGIGIRFRDEDNAQTRQNIEQLLAAKLNGERPTQTM